VVHQPKIASRFDLRFCFAWRAYMNLRAIAARRLTTISSMVRRLYSLDITLS